MTENVTRLTYQVIKRKDQNDNEIEYKEAVLVNGTTHKVPMNEDFIYVKVGVTASIHHEYSQCIVYNSQLLLGKLTPHTTC